MIRFHLNTRKAAVALGLGFGLSCFTPVVTAGGLGGVGKQLSNAGGQLSNAGKQAGGAVSGAVQSGGHRAQESLNSGRQSASKKTQQAESLGRHVAAQATKSMGSKASKATRQAGSVAADAYHSGAVQASRQAEVIRQNANTVTGVVRSQVNTTKEIAKTGVKTVVNTKKQLDGVAKAAADRASREAANAIPSAQKALFGPKSKIIDVSNRTRCFPHMPKPIPKPKDKSGTIVVENTYIPIGDSKPNRTAEILAGVGAIVGAAVSGASGNFGTGGDDGEMAFGGGQSAMVEVPEETERWDEQPIVAGDEITATVQLYNLDTTARNFTLEASDGQREDATLEAGTAIELNVESVVVTFLCNGEPRRYTLSAGNAYKFESKTHGQLDLFAFDPSVLSDK